MKKLISIILTICITLSMNISAFASEPFLNNVFIAKSNHTVSQNVSCSLTSHVIGKEIIAIAEYDNKSIAVIYNSENGNITYVNDYYNAYKVLLTTNISSLADRVITTRSIVTSSDRWFGYTYYYNTSSAYGDRYWRLDNPYRNPVRKSFFTTIGDTNHYNATQFMNEIESMIDDQDDASSILGTGAASTAAMAIITAIVAGSGGTGGALLALIVATLEALGYTLSAQYPYYYAFEHRYNADYYFDMVITD